MPLDIGDALRDGASRTVELNGVVLMAGFAVVGLATLVVQQSFLEWYFGWLGTLETAGPMPGGEELPLALGLSPVAAAVLWLGTAVVAEAYRIVAVRTMVSDHTDTIPREFLTRNIGWATLNGFVGGVVVAVLVGLGALALLVPGIFLAVSFLFVRQEIAVRDANFVDAMVESWALSGGNRVELAVLGVVWVTLGVVLLVVDFAVGQVLPAGSPVPPVVSVLLSAPLTVFVVATAARAYVQLTGDRDGAETVDAGGDEEWPDPPGVDV